MRDTSLKAAFLILIWNCSVYGIETASSEPDDLHSVGKADTGYLSDRAIEVEAIFSGALVFHEDRLITVLDATAYDCTKVVECDEPKPCYEQTQCIGPSVFEQTTFDQFRFASQLWKKAGIHLNQPNEFRIAGVSPREDDFLEIRWEAKLEAVVRDERLLLQSDLSIDELHEPPTIAVPDQPARMLNDVGDACMRNAAHYPTIKALHEHHDVEAYYYYFEPNAENCEEAMSKAGIGRIRPTLRYTRTLPTNTASPKYDLLAADGRVDAVVFFGAQHDDWQPGKKDLGTSERDFFVEMMIEEGFESLDTDEGHSLVRTIDGLTQAITVIGPETLKHLGNDPDEIFKRHVSENEIIFYNGHSFYGSLDVFNSPEIYPGRYQIFFFNSCWSYQYYTQQVFQNQISADNPKGWALVDVVNNLPSNWLYNTAEESHLLLTSLLVGAQRQESMDGHPPDWKTILHQMNKYAEQSAEERGKDRYELYGVSGVRVEEEQSQDD